MDNDQQIQEIFNYRSYLQQSFGIILDEETAAKLWILKYAAIWRLIQNQRADQKKKTSEIFFCNYSKQTSSTWKMRIHLHHYYNTDGFTG
jgi:hypothetical protein